MANRGRSRSQVVESTNRLCHSSAGGPEPATCTFSGPTLVGIDIDVVCAGSFIAISPSTSDSEASVTEVCCTVVPTSRDLLPDRLAIGQLLGRLLREFRAELFRPAGERGYPDLREPHLHIFGNVGIDGIRLTDLASRAQLSLATTSELVTDLQRLGYFERQPIRPIGGPS